MNFVKIATKSYIIKNKLFNKKTIMKSTNKNIISKVAIGIIFLIGMLGVAAQVTAEFMGDSLADQEAAYKLHHESLKMDIEAHCLEEISMAKKKLENHYAGQTTLPKEEIERLGIKAEGQNLACRTF